MVLHWPCAWKKETNIFKKKFSLKGISIYLRKILLHFGIAKQWLMENKPIYLKEIKNKFQQYLLL